MKQSHEVKQIQKNKNSLSIEFFGKKQTLGFQFLYLQKQIMNFIVAKSQFIDQNFNNCYKHGYQANPNKNINILIRNNQISQRTGHWTQKQNAKYFAFLKIFKHKFNQKQSRRQWKVFKALSEFIKTRNANQCRSHHHKMQKNFKTIQETLNYLVKKRPSIDQRSKEYIKKLEYLQSIIFAQGNAKCLQIRKKDQNQRKNKNQVYNQIQLKIKRCDQNDEKKDAANAKTGTCYDAQEFIQPQNQMKLLNALPVDSFFKFSIQNVQAYPNSNLKKDGKKQNENSFDNIQNLQIQSLCSVYERPYLTPYEKKAIQCQQSFMKWYKKALSLTQQKDPYFPNYKLMTPNNNQYIYPFF